MDWKSIDRYLAGEASPAEAEEIRAWLARDPAARELVRRIEAEAQLGDDAFDTDAAWARLRPRLAASDVVSLEERRRARMPFGGRWLVRAAAAVLLVGASLAAWRHFAHGGEQGSVASGTIEAPRGELRTVRLADGTTVMLSGGSRLRLGADYSGATRDVHLEGEGYFSVSHDERRPFRVHAAGGVANDLGTRFTVRAAPELGALEVMVAEGAVSLRSDRSGADSVVLRVGDLGQLEHGGTPTVQHGVDVERYLAWTRGMLDLDGLTLAEALPRIERRYDVRIRLADSSFGERRVGGQFHGESVTQALDALSLAIGARWTRSGDTIVIAPAR